MQKYLVAFSVMVCLFVIPALAGAADLVPECGGAGEPACQACYAVELVNNVVAWLVMILGTIAAILIVVAGVKLVTSGGNSGAKEAAKSSMTNLIIGYLIVLSAWLVLDYGLKALLIEGGTGNFGIWNQISCVDQPDPKLSTVTQIPVEWIEYTPPPTGTYVDPIMSGGGTGGSNPPNLSAAGSCSSNLISPYFGSQLGNAQCIIRHESACGANMVSRSDVMRNDPNRRAFSFGPMQINLTVHVLQGCSGYPSTLDCKSAFSGRNYDARVINESLYQQCARAAQNPTCNIKNGARIYREAGNSWRPWSTAGVCGLR